MQNEFTHPKFWQFASGVIILFVLFMGAFMMIPEDRLPPIPANHAKDKI